MAEKVGVEATKVNYISLWGGVRVKRLFRGQITAYLSGYGELVDLLSANKVRALGISGDKRLEVSIFPL